MKSEVFDQIPNCRTTLTGKQGRGISFLKLFSVIPLVNIGYLRMSLSPSDLPPIFPQLLIVKGTGLGLKCSQLSSAFKTIQQLNPGSSKANFKVTQNLSFRLLLQMNFSSVSKYLTSREKMHFHFKTIFHL